jgi:hypothetical protein
LDIKTLDLAIKQTSREQYRYIGIYWSFHQGPIFAQRLVKILAFFAQTTTSFWENLNITLVFEKNAFFRRKLAKIAENSYHNIDPRRLSGDDFSLH